MDDETKEGAAEETNGKKRKVYQFILLQAALFIDHHHLNSVLQTLKLQISLPLKNPSRHRKPRRPKRQWMRLLKTTSSFFDGGLVAICSSLKLLI